MANYKDMYLHLFRETETALEILMEAQKVCEELYLKSEEQPIPFSVTEEKPPFST